ncbi:hypothetical protein TURU_132310 [Turdus rufiventris]|nr:hypothetical protein TURU_132310 [Turdus rufiventris]
MEPYNVERILWLLSGSDSRLIKTLMEQFNISKRLKLPEDLHRKLSETLGSCSASDQDIVRAMWRCWEENQYLLCPHSAVAAHYHYSQPHSIPRCCLAPASAAKFQDALLRAGLVPQIPPEITALTAMETRSTPLERGQDWAQVLRGQIEAVTQQWEAQGNPESHQDVQWVPNGDRAFHWALGEPTCRGEACGLEKDVTLGEFLGAIITLYIHDHVSRGVVSRHGTCQTTDLILGFHR